MMSWRAWVAGLATVMLAGCGGGGGDGGTPIVGPAPSPTVSKLVLVLSSATISNAGTQTVDATVTAVDANNNTVPGVTVKISVDANATINVADTKTGTSGTVVGTIGVGSDRTLRKITVTATSGNLAATPVALQVIDGATGGAPKAADLTLTLSAPILPNSGTQTVKVTAIAVDANRNTVSNIPITLAVDKGATIKVASLVTDADGKVSGDVSIGDDKSNRTVTVTATSGTLSRTTALQVTGAQIKSTLLPAALSVGAPGKIQYRLLDVSGNPIARQTVTVVGPNAVQSTGTTDLNGDYEYTYTAPNIVGELTVRASAVGVESKATILVLSGPGGIPEVTTQIQSASVSASPGVIPVNTPTTNNQSTIRALFLAEGNAPVANIRVRFDLDGDKQSIGGTFTSGGAMVYSDASGVASTSYVPGSRFSPTDGVTVRACWDYVDFAAGSCPKSAKATLTVISDSLSVSVGTNELIGEDATQLKYVTRYVVQVVDSSGLAAADVQVSASVDLLRYLKGFWQVETNAFGKQLWVQKVKAVCDNEDLNRNGVNEVFGNGVAEDANKSGNLTNGRPALEPRKADVAVSFEGSNKTNTSGVIVLRLEYPKNVGSWVQFNLVVGASGVSGTEGRANFVDILKVPAEIVNKFDSTPAFYLSPYGVETSPTVSASEPGSSRPAAVLCTNPN